MPFFFLSFLLSLLTSLLHCSSCLSSKTTDPRSSLSLRASFHFICPLLDGGRPRPLSLSLSLQFFYFSFSLSLSLPSAIALSPPVWTSTTLTLQYYQHCQVHFCLHSPRSTSPTLEKRRETARFLDEHGSIGWPIVVIVGATDPSFLTFLFLGRWWTVWCFE